jgi:hypothetical protein
MPCHEISSLEVVAHPEHFSCPILLVLAVVIVIFDHVSVIFQTYSARRC